MSIEQKNMIRFFSLSDYDQEEKWLREMANKGWMLKQVKLLVYTFEKMAPQDLVFKLDFQDTKIQPDDEYIQMLEDYGWTYLLSMNNYRYLYKVAANSVEDNEIYTDNASKLAMLQRIFRTKVLPLMVIFLLCVLPGFMRVLDRDYNSLAMDIFWIAIMGLYCGIFIKFGLGYRRLFRKYREQ